MEKTTNCFRKEENESFFWCQKTELLKSDTTTVFQTEIFLSSYPVKKNRSLDKIKRNFPLEETEHSRVHIKSIRLEFVLDPNLQPNIMYYQCNSNNS